MLWTLASFNTWLGNRCAKPDVSLGPALLSEKSGLKKIQGLHRYRKLFQGKKTLAPQLVAENVYVKQTRPSLKLDPERLALPSIPYEKCDDLIKAIFAGSVGYRWIDRVVSFLGLPTPWLKKWRHRQQSEVYHQACQWALKHPTSVQDMFRTHSPQELQWAAWGSMTAAFPGLPPGASKAMLAIKMVEGLCQGMRATEGQGVLENAFKARKAVEAFLQPKLWKPECGLFQKIVHVLTPPRLRPQSDRYLSELIEKAWNSLVVLYQMESQDQICDQRPAFKAKFHDDLRHMLMQWKTSFPSKLYPNFEGAMRENLKMMLGYALPPHIDAALSSEQKQVMVEKLETVYGKLTEGFQELDEKKKILGIDQVALGDGRCISIAHDFLASDLYLKPKMACGDGACEDKDALEEPSGSQGPGVFQFKDMLDVRRWNFLWPWSRYGRGALEGPIKKMEDVSQLLECCLEDKIWALRLSYLATPLFFNAFVEGILNKGYPHLSVMRVNGEPQNATGYTVEKTDLRLERLGDKALVMGTVKCSLAPSSEVFGDTLKSMDGYALAPGGFVTFHIQAAVDPAGRIDGVDVGILDSWMGVVEVNPWETASEPAGSL